MKVIGILRGFPGLGRVVPGIELLGNLSELYRAKVYIYTYLQGEIYARQRGFECFSGITAFDYSSIGIIPVSTYGERLLMEIGEINPDLVLIDGEPLMVQSIKLTYPHIRIVSLLNPSDVDNPHSAASSRLFFNNLYSLSDAVIVHGMRKVENTGIYRNFSSVKTIIRNEILDIKPDLNCKAIYCMLGGGTVNVQEEFLASTMKIANLCIRLATRLPSYKVTIQCSSQNIYDQICKKLAGTKVDNLQILKVFQQPADCYGKSALIITRAGRNTLSELNYLNIPAVSFITGCAFRQHEQAQNAIDSESSRIFNLSNDIEPEEFIGICKLLLSQSPKQDNENRFVPGNSEAEAILLNTINRTQSVLRKKPPDSICSF